MVTLTELLIFITNHNILTLDFYANSGDPVAGIHSAEIQAFENLQKWIYFLSAIYLIIKLAFIALILYTALYVGGHQVRYLGIFQVSVYAELVFFVPATAKIILFHVYYPQGTLTDWHKFYFLSALSIFESAPADWYYALQTLNIFEFAYWFALAFGICRLSELNFDRSLRLVLFSYVPALIIWIAAVTFFTLIIFPNTG